MSQVPVIGLIIEHPFTHRIFPYVVGNPWDFFGSNISILSQVVLFLPFVAPEYRCSMMKGMFFREGIQNCRLNRIQLKGGTVWFCSQLQFWWPRNFRGILRKIHYVINHAGLTERVLFNHPVWFRMPGHHLFLSRGGVEKDKFKGYWSPLLYWIMHPFAKPTQKNEEVLKKVWRWQI